MIRKIFNLPLATRILAGLALGIASGLLARAVIAPGLVEQMIVQVAAPLGAIFLRIIVMVLVPLVFCAIVLGVVDLGDFRKLGRIGLKTLFWVVIFASVSVAVALALSNAIRPGERIPEAKRAALVADYGDKMTQPKKQATADKPLLQSLVELIPNNPLADATTALNPVRSGGGILAVMIFALFFGVACLTMQERQRGFLRDLFESVFGVCMHIIGFGMVLAPICVACLGFVTAARLGLTIFTTFGAYAGIVLLGLGLQVAVVYPLVLHFFARRAPRTFFREAREAILMAFSTASSNATLPVALRVATSKLKVSPSVSRFVLTLGAAMNHNGTALYEAATVLFMAQLFGLDLTLAAQLQVALLCMIASVGAGGIPGGGLAMTVLVMVAIGLPGEAIAIVMGIDRLLDMSRTAVNVSGDLVIAVLVDKEPAEAKT